MANLIASGNYPFVQWQPSEANGVEHTDQEFTDSNGNSYMFRMYNAYYDSAGPNWATLSGTASPAYATVQNPDGSIHYYWNDNQMTWTSWVGSGNNTIYNVEDYGLSSAGGSAASNTTALGSMFTAVAGAAGLGGGMLWIPQYNFGINASTPGLSVPAQSIFQALGTGGQSGSNKAFHFTINDPAGTGPFIFLDCSGAHTSGGTYFNNLAFQWKSPGYAGDTCLYFNYWDNVARDCTFTDCPIAVNIQGLGCKLEHCTIDYGADISTPTAVTSILLAGINCEISGPSEMNGGDFTPGTSTFMSIGGGTANCDQNRLCRIHVYGYNYGLDYSDINSTGIGSGTQNGVIDSCLFECVKTCLYIIPSSSSGLILNQTFSNNTLEKGQNSTDGSPIVFIDSSGGTATNIGPISLVNNLIFSNVTGGSGQGGGGGHTGVAQNNQYGVQIGTCAAVSIIGGQISQMGGNNSPTGTANICISGSPTLVTIDGVNLSATYAGANHGTATGSTGSAASYYGLLINGTAGRVTVNNSPMEGCTVPVALAATASVTELLVTNCAGYNDQNTPINTLANIATGTAYSAATQGGNGGTSYWGPSFVMFKANASGGTFQYNGGTAQTLLASQVLCLTLASPNDTIQFNTHVPAAFTWIGK